MVSVIKENIMDSGENFIVIPVCPSLSLHGKMYEDIFSTYPHVQRECMKYARYCDKKKVLVHGKAQFIPTEVWAFTMVDPVKNESVSAYDSFYQYIVPIYCCDERLFINMASFESGLRQVCDRAKDINASVAIALINPKIQSAIQNIADEVFSNSNLDVVICKQ